MAARHSRGGGPDTRFLLGAFLRLNPRARFAVVAILALLALSIAAPYACQYTAPPAPAPQSIANASPNMLLGNPSNATTDLVNKSNYLMVKKFYALAYNDASGTPNWVSWRLTAADVGSAARKVSFDADTELPDSFKRVTHQDYLSSGFDRGHMCPHGDRAASQEMSFATFIMTNIIPQAPSVNQKAWAQLEDYCRQLLKTGQHLYITCGPDGQGGRGSQGLKQTIAAGKVIVPAECWKIVVIVPDPADDNDLAKITPATRVIAVIMPNDNERVGEEWAPFRASVADIEGKTGYHFFDRLPPDLAQVLKRKVDTVPIPPPRPMGRGG